METATINYNKVFQLAESKGYRLWGFNRFKVGKNSIDSREYSEENILIEYSLIQKWLRDIHKIFIEVIRMNVEDKYFSLRVKTDEITKHTENFTIYEEALLHGCYTALQLI